MGKMIRYLTCHVNELPHYQVAVLFALCVPPPVSCHVVFAVAAFAVVGVSIDDRPPGLLTFLS